MAKGNGKGNSGGHSKGHGGGNGKKKSSAGVKQPKPGRDARGLFVSGNQHAWKPGESANPKGRPRRPSLVEGLTRALKDAEALQLKGIARRDAEGNLQRPPTVDELAWVLLEMCMAGNRESPAMFKELLERLDGKVSARDHEGEDDGSEARRAREEVSRRITRLAEAVAAAEALIETK